MIKGQNKYSQNKNIITESISKVSNLKSYRFLLYTTIEWFNASARGKTYYFLLITFYFFYKKYTISKNQWNKHEKGTSTKNRGQQKNIISEIHSISI